LFPPNVGDAHFVSFFTSALADLPVGGIDSSGKLTGEKNIYPSLASPDCVIERFQPIR